LKEGKYDHPLPKKEGAGEGVKIAEYILNNLPEMLYL
jgi:hypothetical protein